MSRQSYLASEIRWGYQFVRCIHRPRGEATNYTVDTAKCMIFVIRNLWPCICMRMLSVTPTCSWLCLSTTNSHPS